MSTEYRMDGRTRGVFTHNMKDHTTREKIISQIMLVEFKERGMKCTVADKGVDNTGEVIEGNLKNNSPDYEYTFEGGKKENIEIKNAPSDLNTFYTFKKSALVSALNNEGKILVYSKNYYFILSTEACAFLLNNFEAKIHKNFSQYQPTVRIYSKNYGPTQKMDEREVGPVFWEELITRGLVEKRQWTKKAQWLVDEMAERLFREKRR